MTNQLQGEILFKGWAGDTAANWAYTPWIPVRGNYATFGVQVVAISGVTLNWEVETRDLEDPTVGSIATGSSITTAPTTDVVQNSTAAKQLVRYRFKTGSGATTADFVIFRALQPSWQVDR